LPKKMSLYCFVLVVILLLGNVFSTTRLHNLAAAGPSSSLLLHEGLSIFADTNHSPITINGDSNFNDTAINEGWSGNGSSENPFVIYGLDIDRESSAGHCISISNTRVNFTISSCTLIGANASSGAGIYLDNVWNARVVDNLCQHNTHGVLIEGMSENCVLMNNTCTQNAVSGIQLDGSRNIMLSRNICSGNYYGINSIVNPDIYDESRGHVITDNICCNNSHGISIGDLNPPGLSPILLLVSNNNCSANSEDGIQLINPVISTFTNNSCNRNGAAGIRFKIDNFQNNVVKNTCNENGQFGIYMENNAWLNNFTDNLCSTNGQYGIYIAEFSGGNNFLWNSFIDNLVGNAFDDGYEDVFDYNYWSGYSGLDEDRNGFGDTPYAISGGNQDLHPLMRIPGSSPVWIEAPTNQVFIYTDPFTYDLNVSAYKSVDLWWTNDTIDFYIDQSGVIGNATTLLPGMYGLQVFVNDTYGNILSATISITAMELSPPIWTSWLEDKSIEYGESLRYDLNATDSTGLDSWWLNDTAHFAVDDEGLVTTIGFIPVGHYGLQVFVNDTWGNTLNGTFAVFVVDSISPDFINFYAFSHGEKIEIHLIFEDLSGIDHYWLNDTAHFSIHESALIRNATVIEPGVYRLEVKAYDPYGNYCTVILVITVSEPTTTTATTASTTSTVPEYITPVTMLALGLGIIGVIVVASATLLNKKRS
jgi:parallel beta-helix repeat protein